MKNLNSLSNGTGVMGRLMLDSLGGAPLNLSSENMQQIKYFIEGINYESQGVLRHYEDDIISSLASREVKHIELFLRLLGIAIFSISRAYDFEINEDRPIGPSRKWCIKALEDVLSSHKAFMDMAKGDRLDMDHKARHKIYNILLVSTALNPTTTIEEKSALSLLFSDLSYRSDREGVAMSRKDANLISEGYGEMPPEFTDRVNIACMERYLLSTRKAILICHFYIAPLCPIKDSLLTLLASESLVSSWGTYNISPDHVARFYSHIIKLSNLTSEKSIYEIIGLAIEELTLSKSFIVFFDSLFKHLGLIETVHRDPGDDLNDKLNCLIKRTLK